MGESGGDVKKEGGADMRKSASIDGLMGSNVDIVELVGEKEEHLHLKQLVEAHHIDIP